MHKLPPILFGLFLAFDASAGSHRTFVAASGSDSGTCGPTTPCRSLEYALGQTNSGGEIVITQSGGYGNATGGLVINKSVSIIAEPGVFAALAPTSGTGITIATAGIDVAIKGLSINGRGGDDGIVMTNGASLDLDNITISNFSGYGLLVTTPARVMVSNSTLRFLGIGVTAGYGANLLVRQTRLTDFSGGIQIYGGDAGVTRVTASDTLLRCGIYGALGVVNNAITGNTGQMYLDRVTVTNCSYAIYNAFSATNVTALSDSFVTGNDTGIVNNATFLSAGNNHVANNIDDISNMGTMTTGTILH